MARWWQSGSSHNGECPDARTMLRFLSQPRPLELLDCLLDGERDVTQLADSLELNRNNISPALKELHLYSLVEVKSVGRQHIYRLNGAVNARRTNGMLVLNVRTADNGRITLVLPIDHIRMH